LNRPIPNTGRPGLTDGLMDRAGLLSQRTAQKLFKWSVFRFAYANRRRLLC
jgi:hypothetical protein